LAIATALLAATGSRAAVTLRVNNQSGQPVCVMWTGTAGLTGSSNGISIAPSDFGTNAAGYALSAFRQPAPNVYQIDGFTMGGGRMWFTYGNSCWSIPSAGYTPSLANFNDGNFALRYDKIEAYIMGSTDDNLDITAVDAFSIPFSVKAYASASPATTTQTLKGTPGNTVIAALGAIAANAKAATPGSPAGAGTPLPHIIGNSPYLVINTQFAGRGHRGAVYELSVRQQRQLRAHHRQRQPDRSLCRRSRGGGERQPGAGQLQLGDVRKLHQAARWPGRDALHRQHQPRRQLRRRQAVPDGAHVAVRV
jgi:hypothetical protein